MLIIVKFVLGEHLWWLSLNTILIDNENSLLTMDDMIVQPHRCPLIPCVYYMYNIE